MNDTAHINLYVMTASLAIAIYLAIAVYVVTRNPRRSISWVFCGLCLVIVAYYLTGMFLFPTPGPRLEATPLMLRIKWAAISFLPAIFTHLVSFYYPSRWRRFGQWALLPGYLAGAVFAISALFTNLFVAGPLYRQPADIIGPLMGPVMPIFAVLFMTQMGFGTAGLVVGFFSTPSPSTRRQILSLLAPIILCVMSTIANWVIVLTENTGSIPHEIGDVLIILAAFFFANAVLGYGSVSGQPVRRRYMLYSLLIVLSVLAILYPISVLDRILLSNQVVRYPLVTGILVLILVVGFPDVYRWVTTGLDRLFFGSKSARHHIDYVLSDRMAPTPDPVHIQSELLAMLCSILNVRGGFLAFPVGEGSNAAVTVSTIYGDMGVTPGQQIATPERNFEGPQLAAALLPEEVESQGWHQVALFCLLSTPRQSKGLLVLGQKHNKAAFTRPELDLCAALSKQFEAAIRLASLTEQRNQAIEVAKLQDEAMRRLEEEVITTAFQAIDRIGRDSPPLEICLLGPLQVRVTGKLVPESLWGSERAKSLLAYLLWKGDDGATREELTMALWPELPEDRAANVFHVTMNRLRRVLEPGLQRPRDSHYVIHERGKYLFNLNAPVKLDVKLFQQLIDSDDPLAQKEAVALYRGSYMEDCAWALPADVEVQRRLFEQMCEAGLRRLAAEVSEREAEIYLKRLLIYDPSDEQAFRQLVLIYLAKGRQDLACEQIDHWQRSLERFGIAPSPETAEFWQEVESRWKDL
ncbi:MAG: hypothetical protein EHM70_04020 [Chloroflexota bacterium]|nr:MAG: hypothetical protein EHM70_04020 [Chloroflexota bacterium]